MGDRVNLVRPDGSLVQVDATEAAKLQELGSDWTPESTGQAIATDAAKGQENYYSGQKVKTFLEGAASGATLGISDVIEDNLGWDASSRAQYNPGSRIAGELVGAFVPALVPGGQEAAAEGIAGSIGKLAGGVLEHTPAGLIARGAESVAGRVAEGALAKGAVRGAIEGAAYGGAAKVTESSLNGDPLTVESVLAGVGWGTVLGGGLGGFLGKAGDVAEKYAAEKAAARAAEELTARPSLLVPAEEWGGVRTAVHDAATSVEKAVTTAKDAIAAAADSKATVAEDLVAHAHERLGIQKQVLDEVALAGSMPKVTRARDSLLESMKAASEAAAKGDLEGFTAAMETHANKLRNLETAAGRTPTDVQAFVYKTSEASQKALNEMKDLSIVGEALRGFPRMAEDLVGTTEKKLERHVSAIDKLMSTGGAELEGVRTGVADAVAKMAEAVGVKAEGTPGEQLKSVWALAKAAGTKDGAQSVVKATGGKIINNVARYTAGRTAVEATGLHHGVGRVLAYGAGASVVGLLGVKAAVGGAIAHGAEKWAPKALRGLNKVNVGGRLEPLRTRIDGSFDKSKKSRHQLMLDRSEEIRRLAPTVRDSLYRSVSGLAAQHPDFAASLVDTGHKQFSELTALVPRDPGTAVSRMKSMWQSDPVTIEKFARAYEVFQNPVAVANRFLQTGEITPEAANAMRTFNPALFVEMRTRMLDRLSEPGTLEKLTYQEQITLGHALGVEIHSTSNPRFIAHQQAMYKQRNEPLPASAPAGGTSNNPSGGRPPGASAAAMITEH